MKKRRLKAKHAFSSCYRTTVKPIAAHDPSNATSAWHIWAGPENRSTGMQQTVVVVVVSRETSRKQSHRLIPVVVSCCWSAFRPALTAWGRLTSPRPRPSVSGPVMSSGQRLFAIAAAVHFTERELKRANLYQVPWLHRSDLLLFGSF